MPMDFLGVLLSQMCLKTVVTVDGEGLKKSYVLFNYVVSSFFWLFFASKRRGHMFGKSLFSEKQTFKDLFIGKIS